MEYKDIKEQLLQDDEFLLALQNKLCVASKTYGNALLSERILEPFKAIVPFVDYFDNTITLGVKESALLDFLEEQQVFDGDAKIDTALCEDADGNQTGTLYFEFPIAMSKMEFEKNVEKLHNVLVAYEENHFYTDWSDEYINEWQNAIETFQAKMMQLDVLCVTLTNKVTGCFLDNVRKDLQYGYRDNCINTILPIIDIEININAKSLTLSQLKTLNVLICNYAQEQCFNAYHLEEILTTTKVNENTFFVEIEPTPTPKDLLELMESIVTLDNQLKAILPLLN